jgi:hypothetical protein
MSAAVKYLEEAKIEELTAELEGEGYRVVKPENGDERNYDLIALKDNQKIAVEVVARSALRDPEIAEQLSTLRERAYQQGFAEFRLVVVSPPRETAITIDGLETLLFEEMSKNLPQELASLSSHIRLIAVSNIAVNAASVTASDLHVTGTGVVVVGLADDRGETGDDRGWEIDFPFTFDALLARDLRMKELLSVSVDTSSFYR